ncbi:hypothetical protein M3201_03580 [Paenibacillus motobuensis]|uniref:hypothetical protein n=1 Tax=Paenibacillus TaxID=44249 RepID=UPI00203B936B|nr:MULTISPECIES: hypothetical protein [Paenibacillus]MCM3038781.1 hypothetical protein [Paenibacillus lutimineralis]MCM3645885.1 hypothetical protein [Paenibacillus motobuensis]
MNKFIAILICFLLFSAGCSTSHSVDTDSTKELTKDLKDFSPSIKRVQFTFTRPNLFCRIDMSKEPSKEELESILSGIEKFSTIDNINEIARSVKWGLEISNIYLDINTDKDKKTIEHAYYARYFKTFDASNHSETNIEGYRIWYERTEK